jgi:hypothetical protein
MVLTATVGAGAFPVYPDGNVCISILHTPGDDPLMYEQASERWSPVQSVEKVLLSVISMLAGMCFTSRFVTRCLAARLLHVPITFYNANNTTPRTLTCDR